ncbi:protein kinase [Aureococcus anophagefferens]|nr:protein kinase [Aureococcus anophagefferens]
MVYQDSNQQARTAASARGGGAGRGRRRPPPRGRPGGAAAAPGRLRARAPGRRRAPTPGPSLEDLFNQCGRKFSLKTTLQLADQLLERAETLHENHLIHRDIKPANFVTSVGEQASVFCIDFGLSKRYRHPHTMQHIPYREGRSLTGTPRYASVANHQGVETSRRDDLESIGYILVYFLLGKLPWQGLKVPPNVSGTASQKHRLILDKKQLTPLPSSAGLPVEFQEFIQYCRELQFDAKPNMTYVRNLFRDLYRRHGFENPKQWDWDARARPRRETRDRRRRWQRRAAQARRQHEKPRRRQAAGHGRGDQGSAGASIGRPPTAGASTRALGGESGRDLDAKDKPVDKVTVTIPRPATSDTANATGRPGTADAYGGAPTPVGRRGHAAGAKRPLGRRWRPGAAVSAWGEGPRRPRGGGSEKHGGGYVLDEGYGNGGAKDGGGRGYASQASQLHYRHHEQAQSHLVGGSLSLMRHRRASARDRAAQSQATKYHVGGSANYGYSNYGFAAQANAPSLWGHQQQSRHTAWNTAGGAPRSKTPMRPASAVRASAGTRSATRRAPRTRNRY